MAEINLGHVVGPAGPAPDMSAYRTSVAQDAIDANLMALGLTGASVGDLVRVNAVDANGKPTSWRKAPLCEVKTNPNLLDNWYFRNPVNQRGQLSYTGAGYTIDRFRVWDNNCTITVQTGVGLFSNGAYSLGSEIEGNWRDKTITVTVLLTNGILLSGTGVFPSSTTSYDIQNIASNDYITIAFQRGDQGEESTRFLFMFKGNTVGIVAVKAELGSEQTLAHQENGVWVLNEIPDYGEELAKCQRYYFPFGNEYQCNCQYRGNNVFRALFPAYNIVKTPSINCKSYIWIVSEKGLTHCSVASASVSGLLSSGIVVDVTVSTAPADLSDWRNCILVVDSYFNFSADL